jgi:hypothetical protein
MVRDCMISTYRRKNKDSLRMKLTIKADCGNAPKKEFIKELNIAFARNDIPYLLKSVTEDIVWKLVGENTIIGKDKFEIALNEMKNAKSSELILERILTHGKEGAASGVIKMEDGRTYEFADFYEFNGAKGTKIKSIISYIVQSK